VVLVLGLAGGIAAGIAAAASLTLPSPNGRGVGVRVA